MCVLKKKNLILLLTNDLSQDQNKVLKQTFVLSDVISNKDDTSVNAKCQVAHIVWHKYLDKGRDYILRT